MQIGNEVYSLTLRAINQWSSLPRDFPALPIFKSRRDVSFKDILWELFWGSSVVGDIQDVRLNDHNGPFWICNLRLCKIDRALAIYTTPDSCPIDFSVVMSIYTSC